MKPLKVLFLASGGGSNLVGVHQYGLGGDFEITGVICDRNCGALRYAQDQGLPTALHSFHRTDEDNDHLIQLLGSWPADCIVTNVHRILSQRVLEAFPRSFINLHYSHLPAFPGTLGMQAVDMACERGNAFIGVTVHEVIEKVDAGPTLAQGFFSRHQSGDVYRSTFELGLLTLVSSLHLRTSPETIPLLQWKESFLSPASASLDISRLETSLKTVADLYLNTHDGLACEIS